MKLMNNTIKVSYYQNGMHFTGVSAANQNSQTPFRTQPFRDLNRTPCPPPKLLCTCTCFFPSPSECC